MSVRASALSCFFLSMVFCCTAVIVDMRRTHSIPAPEILDRMIPLRLEGWEGRALDYSVGTLLLGTDTSSQVVYNSVRVRGYANRDQAEVTLLIAEKDSVRFGDQIHEPEICYRSQGYKVTSLSNGETGRFGHARAFIARNDGQALLVVYWVVVGSDLIKGAGETRLILVRNGFKNKEAAGYLFRISLPIDPSSEANGIRAAQSFLSSYRSFISQDAVLSAQTKIEQL